MMTTDMTFLPRRTFLGLLAKTGVLGSLGALTFALEKPSPNEITAATFEPHVGGRFHVHGANGGTLTVELKEAYAQPFDANRPPHVRRQPFTLIFRAAETQFEDQMCTISHPRLGTVKAFLSRVDQPKRGMSLQAVFG